MQLAPHLHPHVRHATMPTYVASYAFPLLLALYEVYRIAYWIVSFGPNLLVFKEMGYEFLLMLVLFAMQILVESAFLLFASVTGHPDFQHRIPNVVLGLLLSSAVLACDFALQKLA